MQLSYEQLKEHQSEKLDDGGSNILYGGVSYDNLENDGVVEEVYFSFNTKSDTFEVLDLSIISYKDYVAVKFSFTVEDNPLKCFVLSEAEKSDAIEVFDAICSQVNPYLNMDDGEAVRAAYGAMKNSISEFGFSEKNSGLLRCIK